MASVPMTETPVKTEAMVPAGAALTKGDAAGVMALAQMSEEEFTSRLAVLKKGQERLRIIQRELMTEDEDYGVIPGTPKPTLLKPGSEKLCLFYGLVPTFEETWIEGDGTTSPHLRVRLKCLLHRGSETGPVVAEGLGAANSWEKKHRYRRAKRTCPACGVVGSIYKSKYPDKNTGDLGWYCRDCKANYESGDQQILGQEQGDVENADPFDVENTLLKMSAKRAQIDATLRATATSGLFTQDVEDMGGDEGHADKGKPPAQPAQPASAPPQPAAGQPPQGGIPACPRCGKQVPVMKSKFGPDFFCNPKATREKGCGMKFGGEDVAVVQRARAEYAEHAREAGEEG